MANHNANAPYRLFKRGETWHAYISFIVDGHRIIIRESTGETDPERAKKWCDNRINSIRNSPTVTHEITLDSACVKWWTEYGQHLASGQDLLSKLKYLLQLIDGKLLLSQISKMDVNHLVATLLDRGRKNATVNRYLCLLSSICTRATNKWGCRVPDFKILSFKLKEPKENIKFFKDWQTVQTLIDSAAPHIRPIILTALYTGLRRGRILSLTWEQVDFDNNIIVYMGKDGQPKSVPMVEPLCELLQSLPRDHQYVFTFRGHRIYSIKNAWKRAFEKAGIPYLNFHALRHTTATWLLRKNGNLKVVQNVLGHSTINTTTKYAHLVNNESQAALGDLFNK